MCLTTPTWPGDVLPHPYFGEATLAFTFTLLPARIAPPPPPPLEPPPFTATTIPTSPNSRPFATEAGFRVFEVSVTRAHCSITGPARTPSLSGIAIESASCSAARPNFPSDSGTSFFFMSTPSAEVSAVSHSASSMSPLLLLFCFATAASTAPRPSPSACIHAIGSRLPTAASFSSSNPGGSFLASRRRSASRRSLGRYFDGASPPTSRRSSRPVSASKSSKCPPYDDVFVAASSAPLAVVEEEASACCATVCLRSRGALPLIAPCHICVATRTPSPYHSSPSPIANASSAPSVLADDAPDAALVGSGSTSFVAAAEAVGGAEFGNVHAPSSISARIATTLAAALVAGRV